MDGIEKAHTEEYGGEPAVLVEVPQVTTLLGAFSEFCNGYAITSTNDHGLRVAITPRTDNLVRVYNASRNERKKFQLAVIRQRKEDKPEFCALPYCPRMKQSMLLLFKPMS